MYVEAPHPHPHPEYELAVKKLFPLILVLVVGYIIYQRSPFFQSKVDGFTGKMTKWSPEDIKNNPVKFLDHAEKQLKSSLTQLEESKGTIDSTMATLTKDRDDNQSTVDTATRLTGEFKTAYKGAKANDSWPVTVAEASYTEPQLIEQVETLMAQKSSLTSLIGSQDVALGKAKAAQDKLKDKITQLNGELQSLATKRETLNIEKMSADADQWLAKVNEQVASTSDLSNLGTDPVRDLEDFVKVEAAQAKKAAVEAADAEKEAATRAFLDS